ncbi:hypothetical protein DL89DRAFT_263810 [Linderina pennispora]|uniref:DASH complex subunit DUO1 n=1 Tax=Linderina pennispora TaxID=61395 RepID=A0A1Y1WKF1_9FUNG|nr:uncharacterized protein DL89DRAFT_263810 [Linderina pennispora]ORX73808.1 hypothetical protein DL89DRAFT_263810 [Linderina pennispora]
MNQGLENVQHQLKYFNSNVGQTTQLLDAWVRILSQTSHNLSFLANDAWQGGSKDTEKLAELAQRDLERQEEEKRREREEAERREKEAAEELERKRRRAEALASHQQNPRRPPVHAGIRPGSRGLPRPAGTGAGSRIGRGGGVASGRGRVRGRGLSRGVRGRALPSDVRSRIQPPK